MLIFDSLIICYTDNCLDFMTKREVNQNFSEDAKIIELDGVGNLDDYLRSLLDFTEDNSFFECAKLYIAVSNPELSDDFYEDTSDIEEINLNSTVKEAYQKFRSRFPGSAKPMLILKLYYVTRQI